MRSTERISLQYAMMARLRSIPISVLRLVWVIRIHSFNTPIDVEKAKALLAEAGIETPYNLGEMLVAEKYSNLAAVIQNDLKAIGLDVTIKVAEFNSFIGDLTSGNYTIHSIEHDTGW